MIDIGHVDNFPDGKITPVDVKERSIGIVHWQGKFFATSTICPHLGGPLLAGVVGPIVTADCEHSDLILAENKIALICPWHRWEFSLETGHSLTGNLRIKIYPVAVEGDRVMVNIK